MKACFLSFVTILVTALAGCVTSVVDPIATQVYAPKTDWHQVEILSEPPKRFYESIAQVTAFADNLDKESVLDEELRRQAAKLGADAVIRNSKAERYVGAFTAGSRNIGVAIKYKATPVDQR